MLCPICNIDLEISNNTDNNIVPTYSDESMFPISIKVISEVLYKCTTCNMQIRLPEEKNYIQEVL